MCCEPTQHQHHNEEDNVFFDAIENLSNSSKIDISIFSYVVKLKDQVINELQDKISLLNNQIELLKQLNVAKPMVSVEQKTKEKVDTIKPTQVDKESNSKKQTQDLPVNNKKTIEENAISLGIMQTETEVKLNKYININDDLQSRSTSNEGNNNWKKIEKKRRNKRPMILGSNKDNNIVQGAPKEVSLHVYRVDKNTTVESLTKLVKQHFSEAVVESIVPKNPHLYASFKVTIMEENFGKAMDPKMWPHGACVSRFLFLKRRTNAPN